MTSVLNDPARFADELRVGFLAANRRHVRGVPGGVVRAVAPAPGSVAVVTGGGSGHYPAFAGLVGPGLAHGAAMGNIFASPSPHQVESVALAANPGGGVLLTCGNYSGDVLSFRAAAEAIRATGVDVRTVWVTDDISSAPASESGKRRGVAGGLLVYKIAAAAAEAGATLDDVERVAALANSRTRTLGVAFSGCTLPGADTPLFTVPEGRMAVGMGIHGEPGIDEVDIPTADGLAALLVESLLAELPDGVAEARGQRAVAVLNGLGAMKYEELFVVYRAIAGLLDEAGVTVVAPAVGEFCTSFDMVGCSLSLCWVDDELERLWTAPADTPTFQRSAAVLDEAAAVTTQAAPVAAIPNASDASWAAAATVVAGLEAARASIDDSVDELGRLDAVAGDGDHGIGMQRGIRAAAEAAAEAVAGGAGVRTALQRAADAWSDRAGGTSGVLWGVALRALADTWGDEVPPDAAAVARGVAEAVARVRATGGAEVGDKTMVDALVPFAETLAAHPDSLAAAWRRAAEAATAAATETAELVPRLGRARPHAARSVGTPDPGAQSFALVVTAVAAVLEGRT